jgi:UDP-glucose 4-epimerase
VGTGIESTVNRLFGLLAKSLDYSKAPEYVPPVAGEQRRSVLDGSAARADFGLPAWTPLEKGIPITAEAFRKARASG